MRGGLRGSGRGPGGRRGPGRLDREPGSRSRGVARRWATRWPRTSRSPADALAAGADGDGCQRTPETLLRGLGYLTLDRDAAAAVEQALRSGRRSSRSASAATARCRRSLAVVVPSAYRGGPGVRPAARATRCTARGAGGGRGPSARWNMTAGLAAQLVRGPLGESWRGSSRAMPPSGSDSDGTWDNGVDAGLRFEPDAAARLRDSGRRGAWPPGSRSRPSGRSTGTQSVLGGRRPPTSPASHWCGAARRRGRPRGRRPHERRGAPASTWPRCGCRAEFRIAGGPIRSPIR